MTHKKEILEIIFSTFGYDILTSNFSMKTPNETELKVIFTQNEKEFHLMFDLKNSVGSAIVIHNDNKEDKVLIRNILEFDYSILLGDIELFNRHNTRQYVTYDYDIKEGDCLKFKFLNDTKIALDICQKREIIKMFFLRNKFLMPSIYVAELNNDRYLLSCHEIILTIQEFVNNEFSITADFAEFVERKAHTQEVFYSELLSSTRRKFDLHRNFLRFTYIYGLKNMEELELLIKDINSIKVFA